MLDALTPRGLRRAGLAGDMAFVVAIAGCANPGSPRPASSVGDGTSASPSTEASAAPSEVAVIRCAKTPAAVPVATLTWNKPVKGSFPTINAGEAVAFLTTEPMGATVTEGVNGVATSHACVDQTLIEDRPFVVTFYEPGDYHIFCRKDPATMQTVVHVV